MPNFATGNFKQKNKKFKGKKKAPRTFKGIDIKEPSSRLTKKITKTKSNAITIEGRTSSKRRRTQKIKTIRKNQQKVKVKIVREQERLRKVKSISNSCRMSPEMKEKILKNLKLLNPTKIILLMDTNGSNAQELMKEMETRFGGSRGGARYTEENNLLLQDSQSSAWDYLYIEGNNDLKQIKGNSFLFVTCSRDPLVFLDMCKVADILVPVCSTRTVDFKQLNSNPKDALNAIDDTGLQSILWLRSQGLLPVQPIATHITESPTSKIKNLKFYLDRLFKEEFNTESSTMFIEKPSDLNMMMLKLSCTKAPDLIWRRKRGYMLAEKISISGSKVVIQGQARGGGFSQNELVHVTGLGDFCPVSITVQIGKNHQIIRNLCMFDDCDPMEIFASGESEVKEGNVLGSKMGIDMETMGNDDDDEEEEELANLMSEVQGMNVDNAGFEFEEEEQVVENNDDDDLSVDEFDAKEQKMTRRREILKLHGRNEDEKEFQDEVEFEAQVQLRTRLNKYRYLNSFNRDIWNRYDSIPDYYKRLFKFERMEQIEKVVKLKHAKDMIAPEGAQISLLFENDDLARHILTSLNKERPLLLSSLFKHERKMTMSHHIVKVHKNVEPDTQIESKKEYLVQNGFRRFRSNLMFSSIIRESPNHKMLRKMCGQNGWSLMSHYTPLYFKPNNVLVFEESKQLESSVVNLANLDASNMNLVLIGKNFKHDLFRVLLKRIILTGYPQKVKKKRAIVKFMFFDPSDAEYFMRNEVYSREGLRGKIQETVGLHGLIKCTFNGNMSSADTVCMNLYKRVFPKFLY